MSLPRSPKRWSCAERFLLASPIVLLVFIGGGVWFNHMATHNLQGVAYLPDGNILCAFRDTSVVVRDGRTGRDLRTLGSHRSANSLAFALSPDGKHVAVQGEKSDQAVLRDTASGSVAQTLSIGKDIWAENTAFSHDGKVAVMQNGSYTRFFSTGTGQLLASLDDSDGFGVFAVRDQNTAIAALGDGTSSAKLQHLGIRNIHTGAWLQTWKCANVPIGSIVLSSNSHYAAVASSSPYGPQPGQVQEVSLYDAHTGRILHTLSPKGWFCNLAFSPDGTRLAGSLIGSARVVVWDVVTGKQLYAVEHRSALNFDKSLSLAWSPDGSTLLTGSSNDYLSLWDGHMGQEKQFST